MSWVLLIVWNWNVHGQLEGYRLRLGAPSKRVMLSARTNNPNPHVPVIHTRAAQQLSRFAYRR